MNFARVERALAEPDTNVICSFSPPKMWGLLRRKYNISNIYIYLTKKKQKTKQPHSLKARQGHNKHVRAKFQGLTLENGVDIGI